MLSVVQVCKGEHRGRHHSLVNAASRTKERSKSLKIWASQGLKQNDALCILWVFGKVERYRVQHKKKCYKKSSFKKKAARSAPTRALMDCAMRALKAEGVRQQRR